MIGQKKVKDIFKNFWVRKSLEKVKLAQLCFLFVLTVFLASGVCLFSGSKVPRVGVVNLNKVYAQSLIFQQVRTQQETQEAAWTQQALEAKQDLEEADRKLALQKGRLKKSVFEKRAAALKTQILDFQNEQVARLNIIRQKTQELMIQAEAQSKPLLKQIATARRLDLILTENNVLYASDKLDVTDDLIKALNALVDEAHTQQNAMDKGEKNGRQQIF